MSDPAYIIGIDLGTTNSVISFTEAVLEGVSAGVIGLDERGRINLPNMSASELLGMTADRMVGRALGGCWMGLQGALRGGTRRRGSRPG